MVMQPQPGPITKAKPRWNKKQDEGHECEEFEYEGDVDEGEGYKAVDNGCEPGGLKFEGDEADTHGEPEDEAQRVYEHKRLKPENDKVYKLGELKPGTQGPQELEPEPDDDNNEADGYAQPHPYHHLIPPTSTVVHNNHDLHAPTMLYPTLYTSHHAPTDIPHHQAHIPTPPLPPTPPCTACAMSPMANQPGHVTVLNHTQDVSAFNDDEREHAPVNNVQPHCGSHTTYPIRTWYDPLLSWSASNYDKACPCRIEESCPLRPQPKQHHYERHCIPPIPQTYNIHHTSCSLACASHLDIGSTLTMAQVPAISFTTSKSGSKDTTHQSNNNNTTPYPTI
jgi:hypothetical protein